MPPDKSNLNNVSNREARGKRVERAHQLPEQVDTRNTAQRIRTAEGRAQESQEQRSERLQQNITRTRAARERNIDTVRAQERQRQRISRSLSMRDDVNRLSAQLSDANQRLSHLQSFRTSVARTLHLRDLPETDLLHRLQALCSAHQEFTMLSKRYETASPVGDHPCPRYDDPIPPSTHCRPPRELSPTPTAFHHKATIHSGGSSHHPPTEHHHGSNSHVHNHHGHGHGHGSHSRRQRSKSRDKRLHDECFDTDVHRLHHGCKEELLATGSEDDFDFKSKYC